MFHFVTNQIALFKVIFGPLSGGGIRSPFLPQPDSDKIIIKKIIL
ncbi:MAG: hypothetical protein VX215_05620 [Pseudomonadota bacterium]|nr:hypothetical protein [Pseudomonadota bacterium]